MHETSPTSFPSYRNFFSLQKPPFNPIDNHTSIEEEDKKKKGPRKPTKLPIYTLSHFLSIFLKTISSYQSLPPSQSLQEEHRAISRAQLSLHHQKQSETTTTPSRFLHLLIEAPSTATNSLRHQIWQPTTTQTNIYSTLRLGPPLTSSYHDPDRSPS